MFGSLQRITREWYRMLLLSSVVIIILSLVVHGQPAAAKELYGATSPAWSPDGQHIAYIVQRPDHTDLYVLDVASFTATKLAENASDPSWAPDGQRIAYTETAPKRGLSLGDRLFQPCIVEISHPDLF